MKHCLNEETLQSYLDGEAPVDVAGGVIAHLALCARCAARSAEAERAMAVISGAIDDGSPIDVPAARLRARVESAVAERLAERAAPSFASRKIFWRPGLIATSALAVVSVIGWFASRSTTTPERRQPEQIVQEKARNVPTANLPDPQPITPPAPVRDRRRNKPYQPRSMKKPALALAQTSLPELRLAPAVGFSRGEAFFDLETARHLEKAQVLLRSFENSSSPSITELAYDKRVSKELLLRNILLRREAEDSENAPAKSLLGSLEPLLLDIANLPAKPARGDLALVKRRIRKSEIVAALQVYSASTTSLD